jgi:hypothetical protein
VLYAFSRTMQAKKNSHQKILAWQFDIRIQSNTVLRHPGCAEPLEQVCPILSFPSLGTNANCFNAEIRCKRMPWLDEAAPLLGSFQRAPLHLERRSLVNANDLSDLDK